MSPPLFAHELFVRLKVHPVVGKLFIDLQEDTFTRHMACILAVVGATLTTRAGGGAADVIDVVAYAAGCDELLNTIRAVCKIYKVTRAQFATLLQCFRACAEDVTRAKQRDIVREVCTSVRDIYNQHIVHSCPSDEPPRRKRYTNKQLMLPLLRSCKSAPSCFVQSPRRGGRRTASMRGVMRMA